MQTNRTKRRATLPAGSTTIRRPAQSERQPGMKKIPKTGRGNSPMGSMPPMSAKCCAINLSLLYEDPFLSHSVFDADAVGNRPARSGGVPQAGAGIGRTEWCGAVPGRSAAGRAGGGTGADPDGSLSDQPSEGVRGDF